MTEKHTFLSPLVQHPGAHLQPNEVGDYFIYSATLLDMSVCPSIIIGVPVCRFAYKMPVEGAEKI